MIVRYRRSIIIVVGIVVVCLISTQLYWINQAFWLSEQDFNSRVNSALRTASEEIEDDLVCFELFANTDILEGDYLYLLRVSDERKVSDTLEHYFIQSGDSMVHSVPNFPFSLPATARIVMNFTMHFKDTAGLQSGSASTGMDPQHLTASAYRKKVSGDKQISQLIDMMHVDTVIATHLQNKGIFESFQFAIVNLQSGVTEYASTESFSPEGSSNLSASLFAGDYFFTPYRLIVDFPGKTASLLKTMWVVLAASVAVILLLITGFWFLVKITLEQKRLYDMKADFIGNMTHEFTTPLATISLALEKVIGDRKKAAETNNGHSYINIISQETIRLKSYVNRMLEVMKTEKPGFRIKPVQIDVHKIISEAVQRLDMQTASRGGVIRFHFRAGKSRVAGDEMHLINMFYNLIDNALKYNNGSPEVDIHTENKAEGIAIAIKDNGTGIGKENREKVFEKFYRVTTGKRHDVKGFGIGLNYVKNIIRAHGGTISINENGQAGSVFEIFLPFGDRDNPDIQYVSNETGFEYKK